MRPSLERLDSQLEPELAPEPRLKPEPSSDPERPLTLAWTAPQVWALVLALA